MSRRSAGKLSDEDRVLWSLVARSATPLRGKRSVEVPDVVLEPEKAIAKPEPVPAPASKQPQKAGTGHAIHALDRPTLDKLAKGRMPIEGRVDLHGLTQDEAHALLYSFLSRAHAGGVRYVLVITGKGSSSGGDGVLPTTTSVWGMSNRPPVIVTWCHAPSRQRSRAPVTTAGARGSGGLRGSASGKNAAWTSGCSASTGSTPARTSSATIGRSNGSGSRCQGASRSR